MFKQNTVVRYTAKAVRRTLLVCAMLVVAILCILPFAWMLIMSFKDKSQLWIMPPSLKISTMTLDVYKDIWALEKPSIRLAFRNSLFISVTATVGCVTTASLAAYAFAKLRFKGKGLLFGVILGTMMIPGQATMIPLYVVIKRIGWVNTFYPLIIPHILLYPYGVFLLRQHMNSIPDSVIESAKLDGASQPVIWSRLVLPMALPSLATITLMQFMGNWNAFMSPLMYITDIDRMTLPLYINHFRGAYNTDWNYLMAASSVSIVPLLLLYLLTQRYLTDGIMIGSVKG